MIETQTTNRTDDLTIRPPTARDGADIYRCLHAWGGLDVNSPYAYLLVSDRFAQYSAIGEMNGEVAGFVMGLPPADAEDTLFVWQVGVAPSARGHRVAARLIEAILDRVDAGFLEAHVGAQNEASEALFRGIARRRDAEVVETVAYPAEWFPPGHDTERLLRIGPLRG